jgi:hypothetical protein
MKWKLFIKEIPQMSLTVLWQSQHLLNLLYPEHKAMWMASVALKLQKHQPQYLAKLDLK